MPTKNDVFKRDMIHHVTNWQFRNAVVLTDEQFDDLVESMRHAAAGCAVCAAMDSHLLQHAADLSMDGECRCQSKKAKKPDQPVIDREE